MKKSPQGSQSAKNVFHRSAKNAPLQSAEKARDSIHYLINYFNYFK
jgi:hypothetical protein